MSQISTGIRSLLSIPELYFLYQKLVFPRKKLTQDHIKPYLGQKILDIGCGPGHILKYLPDVDYLGIDTSKKYIEAAKKHYGNRGEFYHGEVSQYKFPTPHKFDLALAIGVLHHINDEDILRVFKFAKQGLKPNGRLVAVEPCYVDDQSFLSKWIISKDRGQNVKDITGYVTFAQQIFSHVQYTIRHDLLRIPYTLIILECIP